MKYQQVTTAAAAAATAATAATAAETATTRATAAAAAVKAAAATAAAGAAAAGAAAARMSNIADYSSSVGGSVGGPAAALQRLNQQPQLLQQQQQQQQLAQAAIRVTELSKNVVRFTLSNCDVSIANALRRVMISEVPTLAIDLVTVFENTSVLHDEYIVHRLGLLPIDSSNVESFVSRDRDQITDIFGYTYSKTS
ncbi:DNA-directed RNA polymerase II, putative [Eimeria maxima]|uniref:DNA-directed RNA polymerase II, putative n=1 Tax=Eimeria maxima TaxID=5804 RepID=U6M3C6_EIMMA|nr:DNA-directed RNA polymerase II, putative [Eimeria maxima]CDJ57548.1 DNA-directed RNA polymerase II, putative [Eimeria maxima]